LEGDRTRRHGIPVTSVTRTLLDVATVANARQLARIVDEADRAGWLDREALLERSHGRKGAKALRAVIANPSARWTRSELEARFLRLCRTHQIPAPIVNTKVEGFEVDCLWPGARLIVELDGYEYHRTPGAFERDRRRDAHLKRMGYDVIRVTQQWLSEDPEGVADTVQALIAR
jgi:very-short-patch-repair endonuclease